MRICFVGPASSIHIEKLCNWFSSSNYDVHVISFVGGKIPSARVHLIDLCTKPNDSGLKKIRYLLTGKRIRKIVESIRPDIISVHYASSYGTAVALSGIKRYTLSVWGSDIYDFPRKSILHKSVLKYSLSKAGILLSTSQSMAEEAAQYCNRSFKITPFGVDMDLFTPQKRNRHDKSVFVIGTVKSLSDLYGIDYIIKAAEIIKKEHPEIILQVRIAGDGPHKKKYVDMVNKMELEQVVSFLGKISQEEASIEWANMDVAVVPSVEYESFGVAAVEAQACGVPIIVSDVEGLMETTIPGETSIVVPRRNERAIASALLRLYEEPKMRIQMGEKGRKNAFEKYEMNKCFKLIETIFLQYFS